MKSLSKKLITLSGTFFLLFTSQILTAQRSDYDNAEKFVTGTEYSNPYTPAAQQAVVYIVYGMDDKEHIKINSDNFKLELRIVEESGAVGVRSSAEVPRIVSSQKNLFSAMCSKVEFLPNKPGWLVMRFTLPAIPDYVFQNDPQNFKIFFHFTGPEISIWRNGTGELGHRHIWISKAASKATPAAASKTVSTNTNAGIQKANTVSTANDLNPTTQTTPLQDAVRQNNYTKAQELVLGNATDVNTKDGKNGRAAIHYAALNDDKEMIEMLKDKGNADINAKDNQGKTALDLALEGSKFKAAKALLENNADAGQSNAGLDRVLATQNMEILKLMLQNGANAETAIRKSIASDNVETMKFVFENSGARASNGLFEEAINKRSTKCAIGLLQNGVDKNQAMDFVIRSKNKEMVDLVLNTGVDVSTANNALNFFVEQRDIGKAEAAITNNHADATFAMPAAVKTNNVEMVKMLFRNNADANDQMDEVCAAGNNAMVTAFLTAGANPDNGVKPAADNDKTATLQILLDNKGDANIAMPIAIKKNNTSMVQMCLSASKPADVYRSEYVVTACENSNLDILNALLLAGAPAGPGLIVSVGKSDLKMIDALLKGGADPNPGLALAAEKGNAEMVDMLLAKGAVANAVVMLAGVKSGAMAIVEKLIYKGGNANEPGLVNASVIHDNPDLTRLLIEKGGDPKEGVAACVDKNKPKALAVLFDKGADGKNPKMLQDAVANNFVEVVKVLIDKGGADPTYLDEKKYGLMHIAAAKGRLEMIQLLGQYKVDANTKNTSGDTPLIEAILKRNEGEKTKNPGWFQSIIVVLLSIGADPNITNNNGDAALHLLCKGDMKNGLREDCIVALLAKGANPCLKDSKGNPAREYLGFLEGGPKKKLKNAMKDANCF